MKRLLVISYYWPPTGGSGVQRWVKFCKYLPKQGWQPVVYTPENPERLAYDESLLSQIPPEVEVLRTRIVEPYDLYRKLTGKKPGQSEVNPLNNRKKSFKQKISLWIRGNFFIPDPRVSWVCPSVRFLKKYLREHPVDAIVTTGPPQSVHLIGLGLKKATGLRWIADFRDPWTEIFYFKHMGLWPLAEMIHRRLEQKVLDSCDMVVSVTPAVQKDFQRKTSTPVELVTNGFDESDFEGIQALEGDAFRVVHTGLFASDGNPLTVWKALARRCASDASFAQKLEIRLVGKTDSQIVSSICEEGLEPNLKVLGYLDHTATVREQISASILLLPLRQEPEYAKVYPGKIFEYIASGRPVLGTGQSDGMAARLLRDTGAGQMFEWEDEEGPERFIKGVIDNKIHGCTDSRESFSRRVLTGRLTEIL